MKKRSITNYILTYRNISQQIQYQDTLKISEERWQFALQGSNTGVWDLNIATKTAFYSDHWLDTLSLNRDKIGNNIDDWLNLAHPEDVETLTEKLTMAIRGQAITF